MPAPAYNVGLEILVAVSRYERAHEGRLPGCICLGPEEMRTLSAYLGRDVARDGIRYRGIPVQAVPQPGVRVGEGVAKPAKAASAPFLGP